MRQWNLEWRECKKGLWTKQILPTAEVHQHAPGFILGMAMSGHGSFAAYRHRIGKIQSPECNYCGASVQDAEHIFKWCPNFAAGRPDTLKGYDASTVHYLRSSMQKIWDDECKRPRQNPSARYAPPSSESEVEEE